MNKAEQFYPELHSANKEYSAGDYKVSSLVKMRAVGQWAEGCQNRTVRLLDVGCGKGLFLRDFSKELRSRWKHNIEATGVDLVKSPGNYFEEIGPQFRFVQQNLDGQTLPFPDGAFDFLSCNHVLEHIFETEKLVREFRRVLSPQGLGVISVPNMAAWINRLLILFGGQPLGSELGTEKITYGFRPQFLQPKLERFRPSGHIRDFTPYGLRDLTSHCGFKTVGWWQQGTDGGARFGKWAGRSLAIVLKPDR